MLEFLNNLPGKHLVRMPAGSRLYGTHRADSDYDYRGVMLESPENLFTLAPNFEQYEAKAEADIVIYGFRKFMHLAAGNNPNILELLFCPLDVCLLTTVEWNFVYTHRHAFLSEQVRKRYGGYAHGQLKLIEQHQRGEKNMTTHANFIEKYGYDTKAAAHLYRLISQAEDILTMGDFSPVLRESVREQFVFIMQGGFTYEQFGEYAAAKLNTIDNAKTDLPKLPDYGLINELMMYIYRSYLK